MVPVPSRNVNVSSSAGGIRCSAVSAVSAAAITIMHTRTTSISLARSSTSASTPPTSANKTAGSAVAVCTKATRRAAWASWTSSHWAPTVCIQVPTLPASAAIHSTRNVLRRNGAHVDDAVPEPAMPRFTSLRPHARHTAG